MRILVMGTGGLGGFFGAALIRTGHEVTFVARGANLEALLQRGLSVQTDSEKFTLTDVRAVASPTEAGEVDLAFFTVKCFDTEQAARDLKPAVGPETAVLTLQNGVDSAEQIGRIIGEGHVLPGTTHITVHKKEPGVLVKTGPVMKVALGELSGDMTPRLERIGNALRGAGFETTLSPDPVRSVWEKFLIFAPHATLTASTQVTLGEIRSVPEGAAMYRQLIYEVAAVGRAAGVNLPTDAEEKGFSFLMGANPALRASMALDYEHKRRVELEQVTGTVVRRGRELGVPTPGFEAIYAVLKVVALSFGGIMAAPEQQAVPRAA